MAFNVINVINTSATTENLSRHELLQWVNDCLQSSFAKIEELHTGAAYCQFTDLLFPGAMKMNKVKWNSRSELDWLENWKLLSTTWKNIGVDKVVPVEKVIKAKFQDNFEFLQWFKKFFNCNYNGQDYYALEARAGAQLGSGAAPNAGVATPKAPAQPRAMATSAPRAAPPSAARSKMVAPSAARTPAATPSGRTNGATIAKPVSTTPSRSNSNLGPDPRPADDKRLQEVLDEVRRLRDELAEAKKSLEEADVLCENVAGERNFYFGKLRRIEILCQENETLGNLDINRIVDILYETEEGFEVPPEDA